MGCALVAAGSMHFEAATHAKYAVFPCALPCFGVFFVCVIPAALKMNCALDMVLKANKKLQAHPNKISCDIADKVYAQLASYTKSKPGYLHMDRREFFKTCEKEVGLDTSALRQLAETA